MPKKSAGLLVYREPAEAIEVFLVHPGGPFWARKDDGVWSIPKGELEDNEDPLSAAKREFREETGIALDGDGRPLDPVRQPSGKAIYVWAMEHDIDPAGFKSNSFFPGVAPKIRALSRLSGNRSRSMVYT
jgi:predicted NUDIX family NTP pyrophosphohydrolase